MTHENFLALCNILGPSSIPAGERWKSIKTMKCDNVNVIDFQHLYKNNKIRYVGGETVDRTENSSPVQYTMPYGFLLTEDGGNDMVSVGDYPKVTFIDIFSVISVTFLNDTGKTGLVNYIYNKSIMSQTATTLSFPKTSYTIDCGNFDINKLGIESNDAGVDIDYAFFDNAAAAAYVTTAAELESDRVSPERRSLSNELFIGTKVLKIFAKLPYSGTATCNATQTGVGYVTYTFKSTYTNEERAAIMALGTQNIQYDNVIDIYFGNRYRIEVGTTDYDDDGASLSDTGIYVYHGTDSDEDRSIYYNNAADHTISGDTVSGNQWHNGLAAEISESVPTITIINTSISPELRALLFA